MAASFLECGYVAEVGLDDLLRCMLCTLLAFWGAVRMYLSLPMPGVKTRKGFQGHVAITQVT